MKNLNPTQLMLALSLSTMCATACSQEPESTRTIGQLAVEQAGQALEGVGACAALDQVDTDCPIDLDWDNHGQYVSCVARYLSARVENGDLPEQAKDALVGVAARSDVGMPSRRGKPGSRGQGGADGADEELPSPSQSGSPFENARDRVCP